MKAIFPALSLLMLLVGVNCIRADDEKSQAGSRANIVIEMQMVAIPQDTAGSVIAEFLNEKKSGDAWDHVQGLIEHGKAKLLAWPMITTRNGQRGTFEAVREIRYATQYTESELNVYFPEKTLDANGNPIHEVFPTLTEEKGIVSGTEFNAAPSVFQTRNAGVMLEVQPTILPDGKAISLELVPEHVRLTGVKKAPIARQGGKVVTDQPEFDTMRSTMHFMLRDGEHRLLGVYRTPDSSGDLELFILRAEIEHLK